MLKKILTMVLAISIVTSFAFVGTLSVAADDPFGTQEKGISMATYDNGYQFPVVEDQQGHPNLNFSQGFKYWGLNDKKVMKAEYASDVATLTDGVLKLHFEGQYGGLQAAPFRDDRIKIGDKICMVYEWRGESNVNVRINQMGIGWLSGNPIHLYIGDELTDWSLSYSDPINVTPGVVMESPDGDYKYSVMIENGDPGMIDFEIRNIQVARFVDGKLFTLDGKEIPSTPEGVEPDTNDEAPSKPSSKPDAGSTPNTDTTGADTNSDASTYADDSGLPTGALIAIIAGAVIIVAAAVVFLIIKKKKA